MPNPVTGVLAGGALLGAGATIYASDQAADAQTSASNQSANLQRQMFEQNREDLAPWRTGGSNALAALAGEFGIVTPQNFDEQYYLNANRDVARAIEEGTTRARTGLEHYMLWGQEAGRAARARDLFDFEETPGYQFRLQEGIDALDRSAASRGMLRSGAQMQALTQYGQGLASEEYNNALNRLASLAGIGQTAANTTARMGAGAAENIGNALVGAGNARASAYTGAASGINQGINNALAIYGWQNGRANLTPTNNLAANSLARGGAWPY